MVTIPQSINASVDTIRGYFNVYLMHKVYVEHLANLSGLGLFKKGWVTPITANKVHKNLTKLLTVMKHNVKKLAQLVSQFSYVTMFTFHVIVVVIL